MPSTASPRANRGPAAAAENRRALIAAAREVYADGGLAAPFSAVAKRAGVGQGSLYRHFPDRTALAVAVFEENVAELEEYISDPDRTIDDLLDRVVAQAVESTALLELITADLKDPRVQPLGERFAVVVSSLAYALYSRATWPWIALGWVGLVPWLRVLDRVPGMRGALAAGVAMAVAFELAVFGWFAPAMADYTGAPTVVLLAVLTLLSPLLQPELVTVAVARVYVQRAGFGPIGVGLVSVYSSTSGVVLPAFLPMVPDLATRLGGVDPLPIAWSMKSFCWNNSVVSMPFGKVG